MRTIHLAEDLDRFLHEAVHSGRYANEDSVISDALNRLRDAISVGDKGPDDSSSASQSGKLLTKQVFQRHLVEIGLLDPPVPPPREPENPAPPTSHADEDEILSEVVIRERLIEWLTGFLT